jgi:hypothetical protein
VIPSASRAQGRGRSRVSLRPKSLDLIDFGCFALVGADMAIATSRPRIMVEACRAF